MRRMFSQKQIEELSKSAVQEAISSGQIEIGTKLYKHKIDLTNENAKQTLESAGIIFPLFVINNSSNKIKGSDFPFEIKIGTCVSAFDDDYDETNWEGL